MMRINIRITSAIMKQPRRLVGISRILRRWMVLIGTMGFLSIASCVWTSHCSFPTTVVTAFIPTTTPVSVGKNPLRSLLPWETPSSKFQNRHSNLLQKRKKISSNSLGNRNTLLYLSPPLVTNSFQGLLTTVGSPLLATLVLATVILVHEAGHFLAARYFQITVQEFSVGIGPKLFGYTNRNDNVTYNLRVLPFGGYVRFPENYNVTLLQQLEDELRQQERTNNKKKPDDVTTPSTTTNSFQFLTNFFLQTNPFTKPTTTSSTATSIITQKKTTTKKPLVLGTAPKVQQQPASAVKVLPPPITYYTDPNLLQNRPWVQRLIVLSGGVIFNIILSFLLYLGQATVGNGIPKPTFAPGALVTQEPSRTAPSFGYLYPGDVIVEINGEPLTLRNTASGLESQKGITEFIRKVRSTPNGESIQLGVIHSTTTATTTTTTTKDNNLSLKISSQPQQPTQETIVLTPQKLRRDDPSSPLSIGVMLGPNYQSTEYVRTTNLPAALQLASQEVSTLAKDTITSFADAASTILSGFTKGNSAAGTNDLSTTGISGPIGVLKIGTDMVRTGDSNAVIFFAAAISINLAVFNSLPLPALDGGQIVFVLGEAISGKRIDQRLQEEINAVALLVLLLTSFSTVLIDL